MPVAPKRRTRLVDHIRTAARDVRAKLEGLPRTEQSLGIAKNEGVEASSYLVKRSPDPGITGGALAKLKPKSGTRRVKPAVKPTARPPLPPPEIVEEPALAMSASRASRKNEIAKKSSSPVIPASINSKIKEVTDVVDPAVLETLLESFPEPVVAESKKKIESVREAQPAPPLPPTRSPEAPEDVYPVLAGNSIFRSVVVLVSTAAMRVGSEALGTEITAVIAPTESGDKVAVTALTEPPGAANEVAAAPKLAARVASGDGGLGLSLEDVIDLTKADDDLPFVKHEPPSASTSAGTGDLVISAINETNFDIASSQMEFSGNVQVKSPRFAMRCDRFIVHLKADGTGMDYGEGIGNVFIRMQEDGKPTGHEGFAERAIYRPGPGKLTLSGWPKIREQHKEHVAATRTTQMVLYTDGRVKTLGRNRTVIRN